MYMYMYICVYICIYIYIYIYIYAPRGPNPARGQFSQVEGSCVQSRGLESRTPGSLPLSRKSNSFVRERLSLSLRLPGRDIEGKSFSSFRYCLRVQS